MCDFSLEFHTGVTKGDWAGFQLCAAWAALVVLLQRWVGLTDCNNFVYWGVRGEPSLCSSFYFNLL